MNHCSRMNGTQHSGERHSTVLGLSDHRTVQEVHSQTAEAQILVSSNWITNVAVSSVTLFVPKTVNRHRKEFHSILEIVVDVLSCRSSYVKLSLSKRLCSSFVVGQSAEGGDAGAWNGPALWEWLAGACWGGSKKNNPLIALFLLPCGSAARTIWQRRATARLAALAARASASA
jgi:hypothetical protein